MRIDAHHHFWSYKPADYGWIDDSMEVIRRDFLPADLESTIAAADVDGVVSVQARQSLVETSWLLELAERNEFIRGVVGWIDLCSDQVEGQLEEYGSHQKLKAVRHVVQDEPDDGFLLRSEFNRGIRLLRENGLVYDILIFERHLRVATEFVDQHPEQVFVLDHVAKPRIAENILEPWRADIFKLAQRPNVFCKVSGMVTEADPKHWSADQLRPYWDAVLEAFGPARLMFGSDWPVCLLGCSYGQWCETVRGFAAELSEREQQALFGQTAIEAYKLT